VKKLDEIMNALKKHKKELKEKFGVKKNRRFWFLC
jgi:hypothetical protein